MSRCFPYPPPGFVKKELLGEALIDSIKLQRINEKSLTEPRREKKRDRKEKRDKKDKKDKKESEKKHKKDKKEKERKETKEREKKEKAKETTCETNSAQLKKIDDLSRAYTQVDREEENEHVEKSDLTVEHGQPISQKLCYLSDSTQSNKRKRAFISNESPNNSNSFRIRFSFKKQEEASPLHSNEKSCSTSTDFHHSQSRNDVATPQFQDSDIINTVAPNTVVPNTVVPKVVPNTVVPNTAFIASNSNELKDNKSTHHSKKTHKHKKHRHESIYDALVNDWVPPPSSFELQCDTGNEDWLLGTKQHQHKKSLRPNESDNAFLPYQSFNIQPCAHVLTSCDIYALPYTIPF